MLKRAMDDTAYKALFFGTQHTFYIRVNDPSQRPFKWIKKKHEHEERTTERKRNTLVPRGDTTILEKQQYDAI